MAKNITLLLVCGSVIIYVFSTNSYMLETLPWDTSVPFKHNIAPYLALFLCIVSPYMIISTLFGINEGNIKTDKHTERVIGVINSIEYSDYRINNKPRFKVLVGYDGIEHTFNALSEKIQFHFKIGDEAIIYYNPNDKYDAYFDMEESIKNKETEA